MVVCFTDANRQSIMAIGMKNDTGYWKSEMIAHYLQVQEPVRVYEFLEYVTVLLQGIPKQPRESN